jgi:phosphopantothenoylcysteine decarboxylase/phosphopantothenate--cysteine ligase
MRVLITAGPTHEPIDPIRYIGNRSSGKVGAALAASALKSGHSVTMIAGPISVPIPTQGRRIDVQTAAQMLDRTMSEFPAHDLLILAAAVADFRPKLTHDDKLARHAGLTIEFEPTEDIAAAAGRIKRPDQRTIGFSLEKSGNLDRARQKLLVKNLDLIVYNPTETIGSDVIEPVLLYPDGRTEVFPSASKGEFADNLFQKAMALWA